MDRHSVGRIGQYITAAKLETLGANSSIVELPGTDLIALYEGRTIRVQVKATGGVPMGRSKYRFLAAAGAKKKVLTTFDCDLVAFVVCPINAVLFKHVTQIKTARVSFGLQRFEKPYLAQNTFHRSIEIFDDLTKR